MAIEKYSVVQLKSGGPKMTVIRIVGDEDNSNLADFAYKHTGHKDGDLICEWFDDKKVSHSKVFPLGAVKEINEV
ncbi:MAG: putative small protein [Bacteroidetes bacterium]|nr:putative small protein [Bacteroidota bacterium]